MTFGWRPSLANTLCRSPRTTHTSRGSPASPCFGGKAAPFNPLPFHPGERPLRPVSPSGHSCLPPLAARLLPEPAAGRRRSASERPTSPSKTRVGGCRHTPSGRSSRTARRSLSIATDCPLRREKPASGRPVRRNRDPMKESRNSGMCWPVRSCSACGVALELGKSDSAAGTFNPVSKPVPQRHATDRGTDRRGDADVV